MSQEVYDSLIAQYKKQGYPEVIGQPGHDLIIALLSVWRERGYPDQFKLGNGALSEKCGTGPSNIAKLRERVFGEVRFDNQGLFSYKSFGQSQPGLYKFNPAIIALFKNHEEVKEEAITKEVTSKETKRGSAWKIIPFQNLPELSETQGIAQSQLEILNRFGLNHLRNIDCRYYTPSTDDAIVLYALFRIHTPRYIKQQAEEAKKQNIDNVLVWLQGDIGE